MENNNAVNTINTNILGESIDFYSIRIANNSNVIGFYKAITGLAKGSIWLFINEIDAIYIAGFSAHEFGCMCHFNTFSCTDTAMWERMDISHMHMY